MTRPLDPSSIALMPLIVHVKAPKTDLVRSMQVALGVLIGVQVREWQRDADKDNPNGLLLDVAAQFADPLLRKLPSALASLLP